MSNECTRCGWCCNHVTVKITPHMFVTPASREWMNARGIRIFKDQMVIPSGCPHLRAELIDIEKSDNSVIAGSGRWVTKCDIQETKPILCKMTKCIKLKYPGIDEV